MSGYLLGAATLEGKAAALSVEYGKGRVLLLGFRPQWRGQSHAAYKFFMNALYLVEAPPVSAPPSSPPTPAR